VARHDLIVALGENPDVYDIRRLEIMVRRLRNKAEKTLGRALPLETVHRQGLAFTEPIHQR
jgi:DNA-binding response OmpR family regulator